MSPEAANFIKCRTEAQRANAELKKAREALVAHVHAQVLTVIESLKPKYPDLQYVTDACQLVSTSPNSSKKRPRAARAPLYFYVGINPFWREYKLAMSEAEAIGQNSKAYIPEVVEAIKAALPEWSYVEGSQNVYDYGPHYNLTWAMLPLK